MESCGVTCCGYGCVLSELWWQADWMDERGLDGHEVRGRLSAVYNVERHPPRRRGPRSRGPRSRGLATVREHPNRVRTTQLKEVRTLW